MNCSTPKAFIKHGILSFFKINCFIMAERIVGRPISCSMTKPTKWPVRPMRTQISLPGIGPVWSASSLSARKNLGSLATHWAHNEDSDQTGWMPRLIGVFAECTSFCWFCCAAALIILIWATSCENMSSGIFDQVRFKPACSATETN